MTSTAKARPLFVPPIVRRAVIDSLRKLNPRHQVHNPVIFTVFVGSLLTAGLGVHALWAGGQESPIFVFSVSAADAQLVAIDRALGFDWQEWFAWVNRHPFLRTVLKLAYDITGIEIIFCWLWLSLKGKREILEEFLWAGMISILIITPIYALLPAKGPWVFFDTGLYANWIRDFFDLRDNAMPVLDCRKIVGIVVCPSFHTALGVILLAIARSQRWILAGSVLLNGTMILSVLTEGSHYLIDLLSGAAVAIVSLHLTAWAKHGVYPSSRALDGPGPCVYVEGQNRNAL